MKLNSKKLIPYLIVIIPLVLVLSVSFFISSFYLNKVESYFAQAKENSIEDYINLQKAQSEQMTNQLTLLFEYTNNRVEPLIEKELKSEVDLAYKIARKIYKKYRGKKSSREIKQRIKDSLSEMVFNNKSGHIFVTDFSGNAILNGSHLKDKDIARYRDADNRAIILEEIHKVKKRKEGFLRSFRYKDNEKEIIYVKDLEIYNWYIGSSNLVKRGRVKLKSNLLEMIKSIPIEQSDFIGVYENNEKLYLSNDFEIKIQELDKDGKWHKHQIKNYYYFARYYKEFNWSLVYGFNTTSMSKQAKKKHEELELMLAGELEFIIKASALIIMFVVLLSLLLSLKINKIFKNYQKEVESRTEELEELNSSLERRVKEEVSAHREKDKMLTQSAKMAEMGDMLSMIAHQWRQPLNQMSYVVMNIESAYEYDELTQEYLNAKVKEANELLEFMSVTIDDFKNYFSPDKVETKEQINSVIDQAISLIKKTLESENINLELSFNTKKDVLLYKNEFIQVVLNLIKNARDVLHDKKVQNPKIIIETKDTDAGIEVSFSDNGGGIKEDIIEKIFEPYFSTKDEKNGTGLGLYMSKMIVEGHLGGELSAVNTKDGASFKIKLPSS